MSRFATTVVLTALWLVASCSFLEPRQDPSRFYVLTATVPMESSGPSRRELLLGIGPIRFPDYLQRPQLVTRLGANQVVFSEFERWAEPLDRNLGRVLGENLSRLLGTERIVSLPAFLPVAMDFDIPLEVLRFESDDQGQIELSVRWAIRQSANRTLLHTSESRISETASPKDTQAVVAALSRAVGRLSEEIATEIRRLSAER